MGQAWTLPNTALGILVGVAGMPFGARPYRIAGGLAFRCMPAFAGAITLGAVVLHAGASLDVRVPTYTRRLRPAARVAFVRLADHEYAHVQQYLALGPMFLPLYFLCGGISVRNRFERSADRYALTGRDWWPWAS